MRGLWPHHSQVMLCCVALSLLVGQIPQNHVHLLLHGLRLWLPPVSTMALTSPSVPTVTINWHASEDIVHKLDQTDILQLIHPQSWTELYLHDRLQQHPKESKHRNWTWRRYPAKQRQIVLPEWSTTKRWSWSTRVIARSLNTNGMWPALSWRNVNSSFPCWKKLTCYAFLNIFFKVVMTMLLMMAVMIDPSLLEKL